jgi:hypothetical protein
MSELVARQQVIEMNVFWRGLHERFWVAGIIKRKIKRRLWISVTVERLARLLPYPVGAMLWSRFGDPLRVWFSSLSLYKSYTGDKMCHDYCLDIFQSSAHSVSLLGELALASSEGPLAAGRCEVSCRHGPYSLRNLFPLIYKQYR